MRAIKFILATVIFTFSFTVFGQNRNRGDNDPGRNNSSRNERQMNINRDNNKIREIRVERQPQALNIRNDQVNYRRNEPKIEAIRDRGNNRLMEKYVINNNEYYGNKGFYYKRINNNYVKVAPPIGLRINVLPIGYINVVLGGQTYFYFEGTYYLNSMNNYYEVVKPPVGAIVYALPVDYEKVNVNGLIYYEYNGVLYQKIYYNGDKAYQVSGYVN